MLSRVCVCVLAIVSVYVDVQVFKNVLTLLCVPKYSSE